MLPAIRVTIDRNEKEGFRVKFPKRMWSSHEGTRQLYRVEESVRVLSEGDYAITDYEHLGAMDTKRSLDEVRKNLFDADRIRAGKALARLGQKCKYPYLVLDMTPAEFNRKNRYCQWPDVVQDACFKKLGQLGINILWLPTGDSLHAREQLGEYMLRILLGHVASEKETNDRKFDIIAACTDRIAGVPAAAARGTSGTGTQPAAG